MIESGGPQAEGDRDRLHAAARIGGPAGPGRRLRAARRLMAAAAQTGCQTGGETGSEPGGAGRRLRAARRRPMMAAAGETGWKPGARPGERPGGGGHNRPRPPPVFTPPKPPEPASDSELDFSRGFDLLTRGFDHSGLPRLSRSFITILLFYLKGPVQGSGFSV